MKKTRPFRRLLPLLAALLALPAGLRAQDIVLADTLTRPMTDSLSLPVADSLHQSLADSLALPVADSLALPVADSLALPMADSLALPVADSLAPRPKLHHLRDSSGARVADSLGFFYRIGRDGYIDYTPQGTLWIDSVATWGSEIAARLAILDKFSLPAADTVRFPLIDRYGNQVKDDLGYIYMLNPMGLIEVDSSDIFIIDSLQSFTPKEFRKIHRFNAKVKKALDDSLYRVTPRMLESFAIDDSLTTRFIFSWTHDPYFNKLYSTPVDTGINNAFHDYAWLRNDVGATHLGVSASPALYHNYFKRQELARFHFWNPLLDEAYTPQTIPFYNTKSAYTLLSYAGTLFANKLKEESNIRVLHTQNLRPETNFSVLYKRQGGKGMLDKESAETRTFSFNLNHTGKRYNLHAGYLFNRNTRAENGGIQDDWWLTDTIIDVRTIAVNLSKANTELRNNSVYLSQTLGIPLGFAAQDSLRSGQGTMIFLGHSGEYSVYSRIYTDLISPSDSAGRAQYSQYLIHPSESADSTRLMKLDNRFFLRIQPWSPTAIVSKLEGGLGYELLHNYGFQPGYYLTGAKHQVQHNTYFYAGASGMLQRYFAWDGFARMDLTGYYQGDLELRANVRFSAYPIQDGIHLTGSLSMKNSTPDWFRSHYYSNHFAWDRDFEKINDTRIEARLSIPRWKLSAGVSYGLLTHGLYHDSLALIQQHDPTINVLTASLTKNFKLWYLHLDHRLLFQVSSNQEVLPLPKFSANCRYYLQLPLVKNVLDMQLGADATFYTAYHAPGWNPALGVFYNQNQVEIGNNPYLDVFVNMKWKRATIFVKYLNAAQGWPSANYFSAPHYIRPQRTIKLGMTWPFHVKPGSKGSSDSSHGSGGFSPSGGSRSAGGFDNGMGGMGGFGGSRSGGLRQSQSGSMGGFGGSQRMGL